MAEHADHEGRGAYRALGIEMAIDFVIMYFVMYTMIATIAHLYLNINSVYMTLMMVAPMTVVMLIGKRSMYPSARTNVSPACREKPLAWARRVRAGASDRGGRA